MCEPTTIIMGVSAAASLLAQQQAASAQKSANATQYRNSVIARNENGNQIAIRRVQEADAASEKINANNIAMREAQATQVAQAGPGGLSVDAMLNHIAGMGAGYNQSVKNNLALTNMALDNQLTNVNRQATNEISSLKAVARPDYLGAALKIGGSAYSAGMFDGSTAAANTDDYRGATLPNSLRGGG